VPCRLVAVEHEASTVVLYELGRAGARLLDRQPVAYHPDAAKWLDRDHAVAAVETHGTLDIFSVSPGGRLQRIEQIAIGFAPRDVAVWPAAEGGWLMLATPYRGREVAWVHWQPGAPARLQRQPWCETPWHVAAVPRGPRGQGPGLVVGCLDDRRVLYVPQPRTWSAVLAAPAPEAVHRFPNQVPRAVQASPSGRYWYVALETGGQVARYDVAADHWQLLPFTPFGAVSIAPVDDDTVAWGENKRILLTRYAANGDVLAQRSLPVSGFPTQLQWIDLDGDGQRDLLVLNSAGPASDVLWGPLVPE
jgi:hypothetical protein